jgi:hypothetical protein
LCGKSQGNDGGFSVRTIFGVNLAKNWIVHAATEINSSMRKQLAATANSICLIICALPALAQTDLPPNLPATAGDTIPPESTATSSTRTRQLTGGVEQKEKITIPASPATANRKVPRLDVIPPVPKFLEAGATLQQNLYPKEGNVWYRIPKFLAGHWTCSEKTITSTINLITGRENNTPRTEQFISTINQGFQQDNTGQIWHFDMAPFLGHSIQADNQTHYSYVQKIEPISCTDDKFVRRCILIKAEVSGSDVIKTSKQFESIQAITPFGPDKIREDTISRSIQPDGSGWRTTSTVIYNLVKPYAPIPQSKGRDMVEMFREYLESNGLSNLIPKS